MTTLERALSQSFALPEPCRCSECRGYPSEPERHEQAVGRWRQLRRALAERDQWELAKQYQPR